MRKIEVFTATIHNAWTHEFYGSAHRICQGVFGPSKTEWLITWVSLLLFLISTPYVVSAADAEYSSSNRPPLKISSIPAKYGEIIYQCNGGSPNQLFIIGMSHRDSLTRRNGINTWKVQVEVYKIGEWLIRNRGLELLLPEGFFKDRPEKRSKETGPRAGIVVRENNAESYDLKTLEEKLGDNSTFVNAEMLLKQNYPLHMEQVEDRACYEEVSNGIQKLGDCGNNLSDYAFLRTELDYLQDRRTAAMLQKIPGIIEDEFHQGNIKKRKAFLTIGMSHIHSIIEYLSEKRIAIYSPVTNSAQSQDYIADLSLVKEKFGVSIILPRTLLDDPEILRITRLDRIVMDTRR